LPGDDFTDLELTFLGTGNAFSMANRYWSSILVNDNILLDASPVIVPHMKKLGKELTKLEYIFITHFHGDHYLGLPFLLLDYAYLDTPDLPLTIIGPFGIGSRIHQITDLGFSGLMEKLKDRVVIKFFEIPEPGDYKIPDLNFQAFPMDHGDTQAFGYRLSIGNKNLGYTGDTDLCDSVVELAQSVDILIIELSNPYLDVPGHMSLQKINSLSDQIGTDIKIIANHVGPIPTSLEDRQKIILPKDLETLKF
jgi:ribonuclease BN (tRNA processing enzyme)